MFFTIIIFFAVLAALVLVHEWGHYIVSRRFGVRIEEFGFGLPPRIFGAYKNENDKWKPVGLRKKEAPNTIWSLNWIPLGGFVKIKGEQGEAPTETDSFGSKSVSKRIAIISAGVIMNLISAVLILTAVFIIGSPQQNIDSLNLPASARVSNKQVMVAEVLVNSPADLAGIQVGDVVTQVDQKTFSEIIALQDYANIKTNELITVTIQRGNESLEFEVTPIILEEADGRGGIGVALIETAFISFPWYTAWWYGLTETLKIIGAIIVGFYLIIKQLIFSGELIGEVYGPVGIASLVGQTARLGLVYLLQFTAILNIIIAVINFLPFPALDGGRVVFLVIEGIRGKAVNAKVEAAIHNIGFALLMLLMLLITFHDIIRVWPS